VALHDGTALDGFTERDPAERSAFNRLFYRNRRPTWLGHWVSQFFCWWARLGLTPRPWVALHVRDRVSGRWRQDAVVIPSVAGERFVVSMFGRISDWVRNVEAAQGDAAMSHGGRQRVRLVLVPPEQRAPILSEYVRIASSGRKHFPLPVGAPLDDFAAIASQYPVYRIERPAAWSSHTPIVQNIAMPTTTLVDGSRTLNTILLVCGVLAPFAYVGTDIVAGLLYPGYSFTAQAPSELFAIGAPTSRLVVPLFSLSSALYVAFAFGVWRASGGTSALRVLAVLIAANGIDSLALWEFPMHMRGVPPTFSDKMHLILAINPFVLLSMAFGVAAFRNWFRVYSILTILILVGLATLAFSYVPAVAANQPTSWLGLSERSAQYAHQLWHAVLAIVLLRRWSEACGF
jgi:hypothetical protein